MSLILLLAFTFATPLTTQAKPDFSGTWLRTESKTEPPPKPGGGAGVMPVSPLAIRQSQEALTIEREGFDRPIIYTFRLDGSESRNASGAMTMVTRSRWEGTRLITEGTQTSVTSQGRFAWTIKEVRYLDAKRALVVETTRTEQGGTPSTTREVFTKQ